jgi:peptidoglycan/xylan/chitin deacetylase (PgdA/CDA1 family)
MAPVVLAIALLLAGEACAADLSAWQRAYDPASGRRFIPVELFTGAQWDGAQTIRLAPAKLEFGGGHKSLSGPMEWLRPGSSVPIQVYERINRDKRQLFAIGEDQSGIGRVLDSRYPHDNCVGEIKFPLGFWKQGEVRNYTVFCRKDIHPLRVTIEQIDFEYGGVPHSLRFHWLYKGGRGRATDMRYTYSPLRGLVHVVGNE